MLAFLGAPAWTGFVLHAIGHAAPNVALRATALQASVDPVRAPTFSPNFSPMLLSSLSQCCFLTALLHHTTQFLDPVFTGVAIKEPTLTSYPIVQGFGYYLIIMICLTAWDELVLPKLQDRGIMPTIPGSLRAIRLEKLSQVQRELPWLTPTTAQLQGKGLPPLEEIVAKPIRVGEYNGVTQYIKAHADGERVPEHQAHRRRFAVGDPFDADELDSVCMISPEFSEHYGKHVFVCKRQTERGDFDDLTDFAA